MSQPLDSSTDLVGGPAELPKAGPLPRCLSFVAGLVVLAGGAIVSFGAVILGPVAMGLVSMVQRRRLRRLSRFGSWIAATAGVTATLGVLTLIVGLNVPASTWRQAMKAADSASAVSAKQSPPPWVERMAPGAARRAAEQRPLSPSGQSAAVAAGIGFAATLLAAFYGTLGWAAGMLLGFAAAGQWPGTESAPTTMPA